eukprot:sb/3477696/
MRLRKPESSGFSAVWDTLQHLANAAGPMISQRFSNKGSKCKIWIKTNRTKKSKMWSKILAYAAGPRCGVARMRGLQRIPKQNFMKKHSNEKVIRQNARCKMHRIVN